MTKQHLLLFCLALSLVFSPINAEISYCEVEDPELKIFIQNQELQHIPLSNYIRGYNLDFQSSDSSIVDVFDPMHRVEESTVQFKSGYNVINIDHQNSENGLFARKGIIFAHDSQQGIAIANSTFQNQLLPIIQQYKYYELPSPSHCYSGLILNSQLDVVIDCSSKDLTKDYNCIAKMDGSISCKTTPSVTATNKRKSMILNYQTSKFFLTASLTYYINPSFKDETYITVYNIVDGKLVFNQIIDRRILGIPSLSITDMDLVTVSGIKYVMVTDKNWGVIKFKYNQDGTIGDMSVIKVTTPARQAAVGPDGSIYVANNRYVEQYSPQFVLINKYELDISDNIVIDLQTSPVLLVVRTDSQKIYTYSTKHTQLIYLLSRQQVHKNTALVVSPFFSRIFYVNNTDMQSYAITSGYISVSNITQSVKVKVKAYSGNLTCTLNVIIDSIDPNTKVFKKKDIKESGYKFQSNGQLNLMLNDFYGGKNLQYKIVGTQQQGISYKINHINKYKMSTLQEQNLQGNIKKQYEDISETVYRTQIVEIDQNSYYLVTFSDKMYRFYVCSRKDDSQAISCTQNVSDQIVIQNDSPKVILTSGKKKTSTGNSIISWVTQTQVIGMKVLNLKGFTLIMSGGPLRYSGITIGESFIAYTQKQLNSISFYDGRKLQTINKRSFTSQDLQKIGGGFYPRDVMTHPSNPNLFYIKTPMAILTVLYFGGQTLEIVNINKIEGDFVPDYKWAAIAGPSSFIMFTPSGIKEYAILPSLELKMLHSIQIQGKTPALPYQIKYQQSANTVQFLTDDGTLQFIKMNKPKIESQFYEITTNTAKNNDLASWTASGPWLMFPTSNQIYYQYSEPSMSITANNFDNKDLHEFSMDLLVFSQNSPDTDTIETVTKIVTVSYKTQISASSNEPNSVRLPEIGNNTEISFPVDQYFNGTVTKYDILCSFSQYKNLTLLPPFRSIKKNTDVAGFDDIVPIHDNLGVITLSNNVLSVISPSNVVIDTYEIEGVQNQCKQLGLSANDLVVLCAEGSSQELIVYQIQDTTIQFVQHYYLPSTSLISHAFEIKLYRVDSQTLYVFIHDADVMNLNSKESDVKMFVIQSSGFSFKDTIDSTYFGVEVIQPINSISIRENHLLVTVGTVGIGYVDLSNYPNKKSLINLKQQPELFKLILDDSMFLRVNLIKIDPDNMKLHAFVTTSNAMHFLISLYVGEDLVVFSSLLQRYNRYGSQRSLNWLIIDEKIVMLAYYNQSVSVESLTMYRRPAQPTTDIISSFYAYQFTIPALQVHPPKSALLYISTIEKQQNLLFIENNQIPSSEQSLSLYNVTGQFRLLANYNQPGNFNSIKVTASNIFGKGISKDFKVEFDNSSQGGIKWYAIVITVCLVLIAVGVAVGLFLRMKARRGGSKKLSLYTEDQEINEKV